MIYRWKSYFKGYPNKLDLDKNYESQKLSLDGFELRMRRMDVGLRVVDFGL